VGETPVLGAVLGILTAVLNASWLLLFREATRSTKNTPAVLLLLTAAAALVTFLASFGDPGFSLAIGGLPHFWLIALALTSQVAGWLLITPALNQLPALEVSVLMLVQPTLTLLWGYLVFREVHSPWQWVGVGILLTCAGILSRVGSIAAAPHYEAQE
jgi:drug/metabolite transporter (DMT)-like permease